MIWGPALREFEAWLSTTDRSPTTCKGYAYMVRRFALNAPAGPWEITSPQLSAWADDQGWSKATRKQFVAAIRTFYAWAVASGYCVFAPTAGLATAAPRRPGPQPRRLPGPWSEPIAAWMLWARAGGRSEGTIKTQSNWIARLAEVHADPWTVTTEQLSVWLSNPDWTPLTKKSAKSSLASFYRWAVAVDRVGASPVERLSSVMVPRTLPRPAPEEAIWASVDRAADVRTRIALLFGALAGLRAGEIARVHFDHLTDSSVLVVGKGGHHRVIPLAVELRDELRAERVRRRRGEPGTGFPLHARENGWVFPSPADITRHVTPGHISKLLGLALPDHWTAHNLRHRFGTEAFRGERDIRAVQELLGHALVSTTAGYTQVADGAKERAVAAIGRRY